MPMSNDALLEAIKRVQAGRSQVSLPDVASKIDKVIPFLPVGSKTLVGWTGTVVSVLVTIVAQNPTLLDLGVDWKTKLPILVGAVATWLAGTGAIAKWQRQINAAQQGNELMGEFLRKLQEGQSKQPINIRED